MDKLYHFPRAGSSFLEILEDPFSRKILGHEAASQEDHLTFTTGFATRLNVLIRNPANHLSLFKLSYTSLEAFLQSNVTGPPLDFDPKDVVFPKACHASVVGLRNQMFGSLTVEGEAVYPLTPHIELFWLAKIILSNEGLCEGFNGRRARIRVNFWHQKLLSEPSDSLRDQIYQDAEVLEGQLTSRLTFHGASAEYHFVEFLVEKAVIDVYYGDDVKARPYLAKAAKVRGFEFALTGALGKRTKFQDRDISQLVVLAKSREEEAEELSSRKASGFGSLTQSRQPSIADPGLPKGSQAAITTPRNEVEKRPESPVLSTHRKPENIPLNDDTLLESIHFALPKLLPEVISDDSLLPPSLAELNPSSQPLLSPIDSIILLQIASSISNTSPSDGLTREETLPYATRVLEGGSSNWQVYAQALLVRSRIEGYRSRTIERGLLQLQALVDQVIVETTATDTSDATVDDASLDKLEMGPQRSSPQAEVQSRPESPSTLGPTSFLPAARPSESASVAERLKYVYQLHPPLRWGLEAELAARWVSMGGLKTALEIYERLQMHAEVALCLAATNDETKAIRVIRKQLFQSSPGEEEVGRDFDGTELDVLPPDAPRLFCILGDLENFPQYYERAWKVSRGRYSRAQRSLGRYHVCNKNYPAAAEAYTKSLEVNRLNASTWFALGCVQLELEAFQGAVESFTRTVQLEADDAEAWSNLAAALLRLPEAEGGGAGGEASEIAPSEGLQTIDEDEPSTLPQTPATAAKSLIRDPNKLRKDALHALRRAAQLKHDNPRIWDNYLTVAASIPPPSTPWNEIILAQKRLIAIRGKSVGEKAVDEKILTVLVRYVIEEWEYPKAKDSTAMASKAQSKDGSVPGGRGVAEEAPEPLNPPFPRGSTPLLLAALIDTHITPLITTSPRFWHLVSDLNLWRHRPLAALEAREKAWRCVTSVPGVYESEEGWRGVVDETVGLVKAYEELGAGERERGRWDGDGVRAEMGLLVARDWNFKARSAARAVMGRGRGMWEETRGWDRLVEIGERLKGKKGGDIAK